jgi:hypothetical protein
VKSIGGQDGAIHGDVAVEMEIAGGGDDVVLIDRGDPPAIGERAGDAEVAGLVGEGIRGGVGGRIVAENVVGRGDLRAGGGVLHLQGGGRDRDILIEGEDQFVGGGLRGGAIALVIPVGGEEVYAGGEGGGGDV